MYCDVYAWKSTHQYKHTPQHRGTDLSRRDTNFGARVDVDTAVGLTRDRRTDSVDNTDAERTALQAVAESEDGVGGLTTLADEHTNVVTEDRRLPVEEVRREFDGHGDLSQLLEDRTRGNGGVITCSTCAEDDTATAADDVEVSAETTKGDTMLVDVYTTTHGVDDRLRLLVDLLLHEVIELALHDLRELDLKGLDSTVLGLRSAGVLVAAESVDV